MTREQKAWQHGFITGLIVGFMAAGVLYLLVA
jgi:hypothetical protein